MASKKSDSVGFDLPKNTVVITDGRDPTEMVCPKCGRDRRIYFMETKRLPGKAVDIYRCKNQVSGGRFCDQAFADIWDAPRIVWTSDNGKWFIVTEDVPAHTPIVARLSVSDDWNSGLLTLYDSGDIRMDEWIAYSVPKYVREQAVRLLESIRDSGGAASAAGRRKAKSSNRRPFGRSGRRWPSTTSRTTR